MLTGRSLAAALVSFALLAVVAAAQPRPTQPEYYEIDVTFAPDRGFLHAKAAVTFRSRAARKAVEFELHPALNILAVTDLQGRALKFTRSKRLGSPAVSVELAEPVEEDQAATLTFTYEGVLPRGIFDYITPDGILLRDEARWYPVLDLAAFTRHVVTVRLPAGWEAVAPGGRKTREFTAAGSLHLWDASRPVSSRALAAFPKDENWVCLAVSGHKDWEPKESVHPVEGCAHVHTRLRQQLQLQRAMTEHLFRYSRALGNYGEPQMFLIVGFPHHRGALGYSAPGFMVVSEDVVKWHGLPDYASGFLGHEVAHQWFPIEVTLASAEDGWLAESLAEYLAYRYLDAAAPEEARRMLERAVRDALAIDPLPRLGLGLRLFALGDAPAARATLYQRGMMVFRTLEAVIGRARVDAALREFYARHRSRSASIADFRVVVEDVAQRDLGWFFEYFLLGTRIPELELRRLPPAAPGEVAGEILLRNVPPDFAVRVELRLETAKGPLEHSVAVQGEATPFTVTTLEPVTSMTLDPTLRILRWTEPARRHRAQRALLARLGELEEEEDLEEALALLHRALGADPEDLARYHIAVRFQMGRTLFRLGRLENAWDEFERALTLTSLDSIDAAFFHAWSRVYRARIALRRNQSAAARAEAEAGLQLSPPALATRVAWPDDDRETSAGDALRAFLGSAGPR